MNTVSYISKPTAELTDLELTQCSELFSKDYGVYSFEDPKGRSGKQVKMSPEYYKRYYIKDNHRVALAKHENKIIAQAFYIREKLKDGVVTWVLQLVVDKEWRKCGIGSKLLHSIWGFSSDYAWGLATANPFTVKTLETATLRRVNPSNIIEHIELIEKMCNSIHFIRGFELNECKSVVDTQFYVDHSEIEQSLNAYGKDWILGDLSPGYEWLAFTFRDQPMDEYSIDELKKLIEFSESQLKDAYGRMKIEQQPWASHTSKEVDFISDVTELNSVSVLDCGCGVGRHSVEIATRYPDSKITGVDFSSKNIEKAIAASSDLNNIEFIEEDLRTFDSNYEFDVVLSLYDVIGSFPDSKDNEALLKTYSKACKKGGTLVISVMNMELTEHLALKENTGDLSKNPEILFNLEPADIMHKCGDVFNPRHYAIDIVSKLVYRKEQFYDDTALPAEYIIRDKRYTMEEICNLVENNGFKILDSRYVRAGRWNEKLGPIDKNSKEILIVAIKE